MARKTLTDRGVASLKPRPKLYAHADPQMPGHYIRVSPTGGKSYVAVARDPRGKQIWTTIGNASLIDIGAARDKARAVISAVKAGHDPAGPQSFEAVANEWLKRHVDKEGLISAPEIRRYLQTHLLPSWGGREFISIRRGDVTRLLDDVEDSSGARTADYILAIVSKITNWFATRNEDYTSPIIRGMKRYNAKDRARKRVLTDDELRAVWSAAEGTYGDLIKMLLLTGQRFDKVASMRWHDVTIDGEWTVPQREREKGTGGTLALPETALEIIRARPHFESNPYIFAGRGSSYYVGPDKSSVAFWSKLPDMPEWRPHDLRRTARSLMSRAGVRPDVAERVLGHAIRGVEGIYDRHSYREEKAQALRLLADLLENILRPADAKVVALR
jgi:integrase